MQKNKQLPPSGRSLSITEYPEDRLIDFIIDLNYNSFLLLFL